MCYASLVRGLHPTCSCGECCGIASVAVAVTFAVATQLGGPIER